MVEHSEMALPKCLPEKSIKYSCLIIFSTEKMLTFADEVFAFLFDTDGSDVRVVIGCGEMNFCPCAFVKNAARSRRNSCMTYMIEEEINFC